MNFADVKKIAGSWVAPETEPGLTFTQLARPLAGVSVDDGILKIRQVGELHAAVVAPGDEPPVTSSELAYFSLDQVMTFGLGLKVTQEFSEGEVLNGLDALSKAIDRSIESEIVRRLELLTATSTGGGLDQNGAANNGMALNDLRLAFDNIASTELAPTHLVCNPKAWGVFSTPWMRDALAVKSIFPGNLNIQTSRFLTHNSTATHLAMLDASRAIKLDVLANKVRVVEDKKSDSFRVLMTRKVSLLVFEEAVSHYTCNPSVTNTSYDYHSLAHYPLTGVVS